MTKRVRTEQQREKNKAKCRAWYLAHKDYACVRTPAQQAHRKEYQRQYYLATKEKRREYNRCWHAEHRDQRIAKYQANVDENRARSNAHRRKKMGLPAPTRAEPKQCENCGCAPSGHTRRLTLDHCHHTGEFRGWLCFNCNTSIGKLGDSIASLERAIAYLQRAETEKPSLSLVTAKG